MLVIAGVLAGVVIGVRTAKTRGGNRLDMAQYAFGYAVAFGLAGLVLTLLADRLI